MSAAATPHLRPVMPMLLPDTIRAPVVGARPELQWVKPTALLIDDTYQRDLRPSSIRVIRTIVSEFAWSRIKPPVAVRVGDGFHVIDGQHTAIAAASLGLKEIPIFVVDAPETAERARAFVSHNRNRLTITALDIHRALVAAKDPLSKSIADVCRDVGVTMRYMSHGQHIDIGDTQAIAHITKLFQRHGVPHARAALTVLVRAKCAPIAEPQISAVSELLRADVSATRLTRAVALDPPGDFVKARSNATLAKRRTWQVLAEIWSKRMR